MPTPTRALFSSWSTTLKLPRSSFPPRAEAAEQATYLKRCTDDLYAWQRREPPIKRTDDAGTFVLHDGPPYANGSLHIGHALNKVLKDIICRFQLSQGKRIDYVPGWDCHGLPIELKALQQHKEADQGEGQSMMKNAVAVRKVARELANRTFEAQRSAFRGWGIMADWDGAWKTMDKPFEMKQLGVFREMVEKGLIYRRYKPVYWSPSSGTALAEAELEYKEDHVSTAAFVKFPIRHFSQTISAQSGVDIEKLNAVIWTTTPWTLPANKAIAVHPELNYCIVEILDGSQLLVAGSRIAHISDMCGFKVSRVLVEAISGVELVGITDYVNVLEGRNAPPQPFIQADFVSADSGSGLVHCAPGHGMDDYQVCRKLGIPAFAPVDDEGRFTKEALLHDPELLLGKEVLKGGGKDVLEYLRECGRVLGTHKYKHRYPYDWRSKLPVIVRATEQWFADVGGIKEAALQSLDDVQFIPEGGKARLESFIKCRSEWCISRQRAWGVPIPALYHIETGEAILTKESVSHIMSVINSRGIDAWWTDPDLDPAWTPPVLQDESGETFYRRGKDTMDVWFDSGTSWTQVEDARGNRDGALADVYVEGTDQHRGWFQSSLLTFIAHQNVSSIDFPKVAAPFKTLITHGFVLDGDGRKMSKSIGNVISPAEIMGGTLLPPKKAKKIKGEILQSNKLTYDAMGPDALRLWVASSDYSKDVVISRSVLKSINTNLSKYRVTLKLLLGLLDDFNPSKMYHFEELTKVDQIALMQLKEVFTSVFKKYGVYEFHKAIGAINKWIYTDLSAFYFESIKDRLYADGEDSKSRLQAQSALAHIYSHLTSMLGPITPILMEESWNHTPQHLKEWADHPFHRILTTASVTSDQGFGGWQNDQLATDLPYLFAADAAVKSAQEKARETKQMGSSLQSFVTLAVAQQPSGESRNPAFDLLQRNLDALESFFVVSHVGLCHGPVPAVLKSMDWSYECTFDIKSQRVTAVVYTPQKEKCARCWRYDADVKVGGDDMLCKRCVDVVEGVRLQ
ncbi:MAG: isoleucine-tRNA ligase [Pycnora praestabilis]|nr:MAG: isoleucine-tRNA ligase [Pycnora praestabilis]